MLFSVAFFGHSLVIYEMSFQRVIDNGTASEASDAARLFTVGKDVQSPLDSAPTHEENGIRLMREKLLKSGVKCPHCH